MGCLNYNSMEFRPTPSSRIRQLKAQVHTMQQSSLDRLNLAQTVIISVVTVTAAVMLGLVLAYWTWVWLGPSVEPSVPAAMEISSRLDSARIFFEPAQSDRADLATTGVAVKLFGLVASPRVRRGYAVMQLEGREVQVVSEGNDVFPGLRLAEVHPDHVVLERGGIREVLAWSEKAAVQTRPASKQ